LTEELSRDPLERYQQFRADPWLFLSHCVYTHDEVDQTNPIKAYPKHLLYLKFLVLMWVKRRKIAVPKSRRLTVSWTYIGLSLWDCIFHKGRSWAFVSKKELDSLELVERANFIFEHIPEEMIPSQLLPKRYRNEMQSSPPVLEFPDIYSKIMGFPSGGNQLRQRGFSGILEDECAFWEDAEAAYASAEPTTKGGGRLIMVSTRYPGFFKKIVYDHLDARDLNFAEIPPVKTQSPMEGIEVWENPNNGFTVIDLSHRANPAKRSVEFEEGLRKSLPIHLYRMEYGKSWDNFEGKPVYEDFNELIHTTKEEPKFWVGQPLLIGWDSSGLTPAVTLSQLQDDQLVTFLEIVGIGQGAVTFCPRVANEIKRKFPQITDISAQTISWIDPAGLKKSETNERTYLSYIIESGFKQVRPGPIDWESRKSAVTEGLVGLTKGRPKILIYEKGCPILVAGFKGGYRYPDKTMESEPDRIRPIKDIHSHPHDSYQYKLGGLKGFIKSNYNFHVPEPQYGFQKHDRSSSITPTLRKQYGQTN